MPNYTDPTLDARRRAAANREKRALAYQRNAQKQVDSAKKRGIRVDPGMSAETHAMIRSIVKKAR